MAFLLAFGAALSVTVIIEVVRHQRAKRAPARRGRARSPSTAAVDAARECRDARAAWYPDRMLAVIPVRDGVLPAGGAETVAECGGRALVVGSAPRADELAGIAIDVRLLELGDVRPGTVVAEPSAGSSTTTWSCCPASPDGRDLAPRLAHVLGRRLLAGAIEVTPDLARLARGGGLELHDVGVHGPVVATLQPGVRGVVAATTSAPADVARPTVAPATPRAATRRSSRCCRPTWPRWTSPRPTASSAAAPGSTAPSASRQLADVAACARRVDGRDPRDHRPRLGRAPAPDRHDRRGRRPVAVPRVRHQRRRPAHRRARRARAHHQRQHRPALPDDADGRPRRRRRRQRRARRARTRLVG